MNKTLLTFAFAALVSHGIAADVTTFPSVASVNAETERAFAQEREADVVVLYENARRIIVERSERKAEFTSEASFLDFLKARKESKRLLVVILGKAHEFTDRQQTIEGFWQVCRNTGFDRVVIQQAHSSMRPILRE